MTTPQSHPENGTDAAEGELDAAPVTGRDDPPVDGPPSTEEVPQGGDPVLQSVIAERDANWERYLRVEAELENYRRRVNREREEERRYAGLGLIRDLLPALDNLRRAIDAGKAVRTDETGTSLLQGVELVLKQIEDLLSRHGATPIPALGETFDPNRHEAIQQVPTDEQPPMTVLQEVERGYLLHDRVIRPSKVLVAAATPSSK